MSTASQVLDPITYEVVSHRLWSINEEGATTIIHASGSPVVQATDFNFGLYTADGEVAVAGVFYMIPIFIMQQVVRAMIDRFGDTIAPGDVFVTNDPFVAGAHQSDMQFVSPVFHDGELIAWTGCMAHLLDVGGMYPGSWCPGATDVFQEGMLVPPARIVAAGVRNEALWDTILGNSRLPAMVANDMSAFLSAHRVAQGRLAETCEQYGAATIVETMQQMIERTESRMREWVAELPDGTFQQSAFLDHDGIQNAIYKVECSLTKTGDSMVFDFEGTDPTITGLGNSTASTTYGAIGTAILGVFGSSLPWNGGLMRAIEVKLPRGSMVSAEKPAAISSGSTGGAWQASAAALLCVSKMLAFSPEHQDFLCGPPDGSWLLSQWGGVNQFGEPYATMHVDMLGWGGPAFAFRDGVDAGGSLIVVGGGFIDVEQAESTQPLLYLWRRLQPDSGGPGRHRGGNGLETAIALYDTEVPSSHTGAAMGAVVPITLGVFGGFPGSTCGYEHVAGADWQARMGEGQGPVEIADVGGEHTYPEAKCSLTMQPGDVMNHVLQNGGGFGDPLDREPAAVVADVEAGNVTTDTAEAVYGVVLAPTGEADAGATAVRRDELRRRRLDGLQNLRDDYPVRDDLPAFRSWGGVLELVRDGTDVLVRVAVSGAVLGVLGDNWRDLAPWREMTAAELGPHVTVDERLEVRQYVDPLTGRSLLVDCQRRGEAPVSDFRLSPSALAG